MKNIQERIPNKLQIVHVFASITFPVYSWATYWALHFVPSLLKSLTILETLIVIAYVYVTALVEIIVLLLSLLIFTVIMPITWLKKGFVAKGTVLMWLIFISAIVAQYNIGYIRVRSDLRDFMIYIPIVIGIWIVLMLVFSFLISRFPGVEKSVDSLSHRLIAFLYIYIPISILSLIIVIVRNL